MTCDEPLILRWATGAVEPTTYCDLDDGHPGDHEAPVIASFSGHRTSWPSGRTIAPSGSLTHYEVGVFTRSGQVITRFTELTEDDALRRVGELGEEFPPDRLFMRRVESFILPTQGD